jgi:hypothetical protein
MQRADGEVRAHQERPLSHSDEACRRTDGLVNDDNPSRSAARSCVLNRALRARDGEDPQVLGAATGQFSGDDIAHPSTHQRLPYR